MHYYFAPMEGVTGAVYRRTHHEFFSGVDKYFIPFITPTTNEKLTPRQKRDVLPEYNEGVPAVPQLLTKSAADCIWAVNALHDLRVSRGQSQPWLSVRHGDGQGKGSRNFLHIRTSWTGFF